MRSLTVEMGFLTSREIEQNLRTGLSWSLPFAGPKRSSIRYSISMGSSVILGRFGFRFFCFYSLYSSLSFEIFNDFCRYIKKLYSENGRKCPLWATLSFNSCRNQASSRAGTRPADRAAPNGCKFRRPTTSPLASFENGVEYRPRSRFF